MFIVNHNADYDLTLKQLEALMDDDLICNLANASALLFQFLKNVNWVGFYLLKNGELVLGPFQGLPACTRIPLNRGVCGKAASTKTTLYVENVHVFEGHIACDANSKSEVVIPIVKDDKLVGVLDIDSFEFNNFTGEDIVFLEQFVSKLKNYI